MKTMIFLYLIVHSLVPSQNALAGSCNDDVNAGTLTSFRKFCAINKPVLTAKLDSESIKANLEAGPKPMNCQLSAHKSVYECRGTIGNYPLPVRIYFKVNTVKPVGLNIHLHGHYSNNEGQKAGNYPFKIPNGDYAQMLSQSKSQKILVIPESYGKVDTYLNNFQPAEKWIAWQNELIKKLGTNGALPLSLSGHSGSDAVLNSFGRYCQNKQWDCSKVRSLGLFDANFGDVRGGKLVGRDGLTLLAKTVVDNQGTLYLRDVDGLSPAINNGALVKSVGAGKVDKAILPLGGMEPGSKHMALMKDGGFSQFLDLN